MMADGRVVGMQLARGASVTLPEPSSSFVAGLPFTHEIEPSAVSGAAGLAIVYRPVRVILRVLDTGELTIDTGSGPRSLPLPAMPRKPASAATSPSAPWAGGGASTQRPGGSRRQRRPPAPSSP